MISIIIPVHNGGKYIRRAIDSVIAQKGAWELVVVNDHSTDETLTILSDYAERFDRIKTINSKSRGVTEARIAGATASLGNYLFFMDADDELSPDIIDTMEKHILSDSSLDLVISDITSICASVQKKLSYGNLSLSSGRELFDWIIDNKMGFLWGKAIRKEIFMRLEYIPLELKFCEDYVQMLQISLMARNIKHIGIPGYIYYQNPDSVCNSVKSKKDYAEQFYKLAQALKCLMDTNLFNDYNYPSGIKPSMRIKVLILYYTRLFLAVWGDWDTNIIQLKEYYHHWMKAIYVDEEPTYTRYRKFQTIFAYYFPWLLSSIYVPLLKYKYRRIK